MPPHGRRRRSLSHSDRLIAAHTDWRGFWREILSVDRGAQSDAFERLTQLYLQTQPEYVTKLKHVWRWSEVPVEVRMKLRLPRPDEGIDILAETYDGDFWAIQAKFRSSSDYALTRTQLSTFVALASVAGISHLVIAHTSAKAIRKRALMGNMVEIGPERWFGLDEGAWSLITSAIKGRPARPEPRRPRSHQKRALAAAKKHFVKRNAVRGRLIMPCGTLAKH